MTRKCYHHSEGTETDAIARMSNWKAAGPDHVRKDFGLRKPPVYIPNSNSSAGNELFSTRNQVYKVIKVHGHSVMTCVTVRD